MHTDPDGDSEMASSPESEQNSHPGSRTPTNKTQHSQLMGSELSPPGSQKQTQKPPSGLSGGSGFERSNNNRTATEPMNEVEKPGVSWLNKRAEEEYHRAMENVVDKDFSLREFGDPFDDRDMEETSV